MKNKLLGISLTTVAVFFAACGGVTTTTNVNTTATDNTATTDNGSSSTKNAPATSSAESAAFSSPKTTMKTIIKAVKEKDNATLERAFMPDVWTVLLKIIPKDETMTESMSKDKSFVNINVDELEEKIDGDKAVIMTKNKEGKSDPTHFTKVNNEWKMDLPAEQKAQFIEMGNQLEKLNKELKQMKKEADTSGAEENKKEDEKK